MTDVTRILSQIESGDPSAADHLLPLVYDELRKLAAAKLAHEKPGQTLQATALVHEAYLRLIGPRRPVIGTTRQSNGWTRRCLKTRNSYASEPKRNNCLALTSPPSHQNRRTRKQKSEKKRVRGQKSEVRKQSRSVSARSGAARPASHN